MNLYRRLPIVHTSLLVLFATISIASAQKPDGNNQKTFELKDGDRVVFLGSGLIEREQKFGYWEAALTVAYPDRNITFRNLGWSGDTVWAESRGLFDAPEKGYARMIEQIKGLKPTVVFFGYGNNEAFAGEKGLKPFIAQYEKLIKDVRTASATATTPAEAIRCVLIAPTKQISTPQIHADVAGYNSKIDVYEKSIEELAARHGFIFVSFNSVFEWIEKDTGAVIGENTLKEYKEKWSSDGLQLNGFAYRGLASQISKLVGVDMMNNFHIRPGTFRTNPKDLPATFKKIDEGYQIAVERRRLTHVPPRFITSGIPEGVYEVRCGGKVLHRGKTRFADRKTKTSVKVRVPFNPITGVNIAKSKVEVKKVDEAGKPISTYRTNEVWDIETDPNHVKYEKLRQKIIEKNQLFFHQWRPQNFTYLFGFRKHEQGQNAKEVKEFDALIAAKEKEIAELNKPEKYAYELIRVGDEKSNDKK